ncbi:D-glucuronyl C5-epimerase family protein [Micromonospora thermarum]|uniref:D-glucuronyl C5-epimerase C-terminal domain-containing protein n=1 Tax=Micromonospora thermarum TaxID=2720024 RepID=A0ABX0Z605_9ACTN|nr:D-glucuronyl C5-epimerase family protein [Micromonospora thermarum]NJP32587.1 hypothetical protein [Micromonospora thermarum]
MDEEGFLWLEEYPVTPGVTGERVLNGHIFALYGVYDYWRLTADSRAVAIFDGAASTLRHHVPASFRAPEWISRYSVGCPNSAGAVLEQKSLTLSRQSNANADQRIRVRGRGIHYRIYNGALAGYLVAEAPGDRVLLGAVAKHAYTPERTLRFASGTYTGYRYSAGWTVTERRTFTFSRSSAAPFSATAWVNGRLSYQITAGAYAGLWLPAVEGLTPAP